VRAILPWAEGDNCYPHSKGYAASVGVRIACWALVPRKQLRFGKGFAVVLGNRRAQAATMVLARGGHEGGPTNRHRGADQWLYVRSGRGVAIIASKRERLRPGTLVLIERGTAHEIRNTGTSPLVTLNWYVPPAYTEAADELPRGRST
jgi:mannose-6-phosphate isomerase-like protein (cupin superfamily)